MKQNLPPKHKVWWIFLSSYSSLSGSPLPFFKEKEDVNMPYIPWWLIFCHTVHQSLKRDWGILVICTINKYSLCRFVTPWGLTLQKAPCGGGNPWVHITLGSRLGFFWCGTCAVPCILGVLWWVMGAPDLNWICYLGLGLLDLARLLRVMDIGL